MPITDCITAFVCHVDEQMQALPEHPVVMVEPIQLYTREAVSQDDDSRNHHRSMSSSV